MPIEAVIPLGLKVVYTLFVCVLVLWQTIVALMVLPLSYLVSNSQENVNRVYGFGQNPQRILPAPLFVILLMLLFPLAVYLPTHPAVPARCLSADAPSFYENLSNGGIVKGEKVDRTCGRSRRSPKFLFVRVM